MAGKKPTKNQKDNDTRVGEIAEQLEHAFMAGLGALSGAQKKGAEHFESLIKEGEKFRKKTTTRTESRSCNKPRQWGTLYEQPTFTPASLTSSPKRATSNSGPR